MPPAAGTGGTTICNTICDPANNMKISCDKICPGYRFSTTTTTTGLPVKIGSEQMLHVMPIVLSVLASLVLAALLLVCCCYFRKKCQSLKNKLKDCRLNRPQQEQGTELTSLVHTSSDAPSPNASMVNTDNTKSQEGESNYQNRRLLADHNATAAPELSQESASTSAAISSIKELSGGNYSVPRKEGEPCKINTPKVKKTNCDKMEFKCSLDTAA